jgi:hypothetical protein
VDLPPHAVSSKSRAKVVATTLGAVREFFIEVKPLLIFIHTRSGAIINMPSIE